MPLGPVDAIWPTAAAAMLPILLCGQSSATAVSRYKEKPGDREAVGFFL